MNPLELSFRKAKHSDLLEIQKLFTETIVHICNKDYTPKQIQVWSSATKNTERWINKLNQQYFLLAVFQQQIVGFASLENNNYVDFMYVHKNFQHQGIASALFAKLEKHAHQKSASFLISNVSFTAKPFFEKQGFKVIQNNFLEIDGVAISNIKMKKALL